MQAHGVWTTLQEAQRGGEAEPEGIAGSAQLESRPDALDAPEFASVLVMEPRRHSLFCTKCEVKLSVNAIVQATTELKISLTGLAVGLPCATMRWTGRDGRSKGLLASLQLWPCGIRRIGCPIRKLTALSFELSLFLLSSYI